MPRSRPSCALAEFKDGKLTVWTHSQGVFPLRATIARALGMQPRDIRCIHAEGAGCYGHNGADDVAFDAALLARAVNGRPVRLQWMRDDEFKWEPYGPAMTMKVKARRRRRPHGRLDLRRLEPEPQHAAGRSRRHQPAGELVPRRCRSGPARRAMPRSRTAAGDRNAIPLYDFPRQRITHHLIMDNPVRTSALRTLGAYANVFAIESFMDELAAAAGIDPVAFRLAHIKDERERAVIEAVAKAAAWKAGREGRRPARPRHRLCALQEPWPTYHCGDRRGRSESHNRHRQGAAHLGRGRCRADHQSRRPDQPDRRRHHPVDELDPARARAVRPQRDPVARTGRAIRS